MILTLENNSYRTLLKRFTPHMGLRQRCIYTEALHNTLRSIPQWVRPLDWRPDGPEFESRCGNFASELWQFRLPRFASVFRIRHYKSHWSLLSAVYASCDGGVYPLIRITQEFPAYTAWWGGNGNLAGGGWRVEHRAVTGWPLINHYK